MYFGKWCDLFEEWRKMHNIPHEKNGIRREKKHSLLWICSSLCGKI